MTKTEAVIVLIKEKQGISSREISPQDSFYKLGIDGDDAVTLIEAFCERFQIDPTEIDLRRYTIGPEATGIFAAILYYLRSRKQMSIPQVDLRVGDLIKSAEGQRWFDPAPGKS